MSSLLDIKILEETIESVENIDNEQPITETSDSIENIDDSDTSPNVTIEDQYQVNDKKVILTPSMIEDLEDKINNESVILDDIITESFYNLNRDLINIVALSETISIDTINKQYKILTESSYGTDDYNEKVCTLIESSGNNLIQKLVEAIKRFIEWCKEILSKLGVQISLHFVDYNKWATSKEDELVKKASEVGNRVSAKFHKWDKNELFKTLSISEIESVADSYIGITSDKDRMKEYVEDFRSKYNNVTEAANDIYCHALAKASGGNPDGRTMTNKELAKQAFYIKLMGAEKDIYMDSKTTISFMKDLKSVKSDSSKFISSMRNDSVNNKFNELIKDAQKEMNKREDKPDSTKYQYFNIRFNVLTAVQNAINDAYKIKCQLINQYIKELYNACKKLDSFKESSSNESIDINSNNYIGDTLHA